MIRTAFLCVLAMSAGAYAQGPARGPRPMGPDGPERGRFLGAEPGMPGRVVKNAPYSADVVTETTQTLADGNHIHQISNSKIYRDSDGRTRLEQSLNGLSAIAGSTALPHVVFIHDPVAHQSFALNADARTATRSGTERPGRGNGPPPPGNNGGSGEMRDQMAMVRMREGFPGGRGANAQNVKTESLGRQTIEGVVADGTRTTLTIPAGQLGNEQPIQVVTERWYSADLQTVVLLKRSDPRSGETVTKLANVSRAEPSHSLFEVPADYKVTENTRERAARGSKSQ